MPVQNIQFVKIFCFTGLNHVYNLKSKTNVYYCLGAVFHPGTVTILNYSIFTVV